MAAPRAGVNEDLVHVATELPPGKALVVGCGVGHDSVWLAQRGWVVVAMDASPAGIAATRELAKASGVGSTLVLYAADPVEWRPASRFDLVTCTSGLPARGRGRARLLEMAAAAVAPAGTILLTELDISLRREGMPEKYLASTEEFERYLDGFRVQRSAVRMVPRRHGYEERRMPSANVIATRRTDLRTF